MFILIMLSNCVGSSASLLGPAITAVKTGNVYHAGLSYTSNNIIKKKIGTTPGEYIVSFLNQDSYEETQNSYKDGLIFAINKSNKLKNIKLSHNSKINEYTYDDFLKAVKKVLK